MKPIRLSGHAMQQLSFRGASEPEIVNAIREETWCSAEEEGLSAVGTLLLMQSGMASGIKLGKYDRSLSRKQRKSW